MKRLFMVLLLSVGSLQNVSAAEEHAPASGEKSVPARVGESVKKGGEAAGRGIEKGAEATAHGLKKAGEWVGKKLHKGGEKSEKASESK
jgi:hypothetical protein